MSLSSVILAFGVGFYVGKKYAEVDISPSDEGSENSTKESLTDKERSEIQSLIKEGKQSEAVQKYQSAMSVDEKLAQERVTHIEKKLAEQGSAKKDKKSKPAKAAVKEVDTNQEKKSA